MHLMLRKSQYVLIKSLADTTKTNKAQVIRLAIDKYLQSDEAVLKFDLNQLYEDRFDQK